MILLRRILMIILALSIIGIMIYFLFFSNNSYLNVVKKPETKTSQSGRPTGPPGTIPKTDDQGNPVPQANATTYVVSNNLTGLFRVDKNLFTPLDIVNTGGLILGTYDKTEGDWYYFRIQSIQLPAGFVLPPGYSGDPLLWRVSKKSASLSTNVSGLNYWNPDPTKLQ